MDNIINELYYSNICPVEQMGRLTPKARAMLKRVQESEEKLEKSLSEQEKAVLHSIQDDRLELAPGSLTYHGNDSSYRRTSKISSLGEAIVVVGKRNLN